MAILFEIERTGNLFSCTADNGPAFFVGRRVPYDSRIGLFNIFKGSTLEKLNYQASDFAVSHGFWATLIEPTASVEGRNFLTLNTYDRAAFTFGFGQFAAHVPDGDFVGYFRELLGRPEAADYFPHLGIHDGRICRTDVDPPTPLEDSGSTAKLMKYLNPTSDEVEDAEVIAAAKLIHWTSKHVGAREAQVSHMAGAFRSYVKRADKRVGVDGRSAAICCVIGDILHHGRGGAMTWPLVQNALTKSDPLSALLEIGEPKWHERQVGLRKAIKARPELSAKRWSTAASDFV